MGRRLVLAIGMGITTAWPALATGQALPGAPTGLAVRLQGVDQGNVHGDPSTFVWKAGEAGSNLMAAARLAATRASNPALRSFAARLLNDHGRARAELIAIARARGVAPRAEAVSATFVTAALGRVSGPDFDEAFLAQVTLDLGVAIPLCEEQRRRGSDADIRAWAVRMLPLLRDHQRQARSLSP